MAAATRAPVRPRRQRPDAGNSRSIPARLIGTYATTLQPRDIPANAPPELADAGFSWTLRIETTGGPDGGPYLAIDSDKMGNLEAPSLRVHGDRLFLLNEECASPTGTKFYDNEYRWSVSGRTLEIETVTNKCPDRVAETIITSRPWTKTD